MNNSKKKKRFLALVREIDREDARLRWTLTKYGYRSMVGVMQPNAHEVDAVADLLLMLRYVNKRLPWILTFSQDITRDPRKALEDELPF